MLPLLSEPDDWREIRLSLVTAGRGISYIGTGHVLGTFAPSSSYVSAIGFGAAAFEKRFRVYSIATGVMLFVFGALVGLDAPRIEANLTTPWVGVTERICIGVFLLWVVVLAIALWFQMPEGRRTRASRHTSSQ